MIRAASYIRVSTERQAEDDKVSLGEQQRDIAAYCEDIGYTIVKEYRDVGSGASKRRTGFQELLRDVQDGAFDVIMCWKSDRLSRGLYPAAALSEALEATDIRLESSRIPSTGIPSTSWPSWARSSWGTSGNGRGWEQGARPSEARWRGP